jgi:hypothetical protein
MLALLSGMEHSHWLCYWGACAYAAGEATSTHHDDDARAADNCRHADQAALSCRASCCCASNYPASTPAQASTPTQASIATHNDNHADPQRGACPCPSGPCPSGCWCQQAPQPLELPRESAQSSEVLLAGLSLTHPVFTPGVYGGMGSSLEEAGAAIQTASAAERCAELCRFLI